MIVSITQSQRLKTEFREFQNKIDMLTDSGKQDVARKLFLELKTQLQLVDNSHSTSGNYLRLDPRLVRENVTTIVELRKQLKKLLSN